MCHVFTDKVMTHECIHPAPSSARQLHGLFGPLDLLQYDSMASDRSQYAIKPQNESFPFLPRERPQIQCLCFETVEKMESAASSTVKSLIPEVDEDKTPRLGMVFSNIEEAFKFYNTYAKAAGFSVRRSSEKKVKNEVVWKQFVCFKEGLRREKVGPNSGAQRLVANTRENCGAKFQVRKNKQGGWIACKFVAEHTHILSIPCKTHTLRSHRMTMTSGAKKKLRVSEVQDSGNENVDCIEKDARDCGKDKKEDIKGEDGQLLYGHFKLLKEMNPAFLFSIEKDSDDRIKHVFWADPMFRTSYSEFGDVVRFDMTYETNKYDLVFCAFSGLNHHGQSILFGCGLLSNETFESFVWLFNNWLKAMRLGPPKAIITDRDCAITKTVKSVMPATCHRFCLRHILDKMSMELGEVAIHTEGLLERAKHIAYNSVTIEQFESEWNKMLTVFNVFDHNWLKGLYDNRENWVPIYSKHVFFGGMSMNQRSEYINAFIKQYMSDKSGLYDFFLRFERAIARQKYREVKADYEIVNGKPKLKTDLPMEKQMSEIYTRKIFYIFQKQIMSILSCIEKLVKDDVEERTYVVLSFGDGKEIEWKVIFKKATKHAFCSCQLFEFQGIPCSHILCVLKQERIVTLPQQYILKRWTRHAREGFVYDRSGVELKPSCDESLIARHGGLSYISRMVVNEASLSTKAYQFVKDALLDIKRKACNINENEVIGENYKKKGKMACYQSTSRSVNNVDLSDEGNDSDRSTSYDESLTQL